MNYRDYLRQKNINIKYKASVDACFLKQICGPESLYFREINANHDDKYYIKNMPFLLIIKIIIKHNN